MNVKTARILFVCFLCFIVGVCTWSHNHDEQLRKERMQKKLNEDKATFDSVMASPSIDRCLLYLKNHYNGTYKSHVDSILNVVFSNQVDMLLTKVNVENIISFYNKYQYEYISHEYLRDDINRLQEEMYGSETMAWKTASVINNANGYYNYITRYPKGKHYKEAEKLYVDMQVDAIFAGDHGRLPEMEKTGYRYGSTSEISVYNNTAYTLTLLYSGTDSKSMSIPSRCTYSIKLKNGNYRIAASVNSSNVRSYAGIENLSGGLYSSEYYITTSRY